MISFKEFINDYNQGKHIKTFKNGNKWCRVGLVNKKKWSIITDSGIYDYFGSKENAFSYADDYINNNN